MSAQTLLPVNRSRIEDAAAGAIDALLPGTIPIAQAFDPAQAPITFLPWLAVHNGVKLWYSDWSDARKRAIIADQTLNWSIGTRDGSVRYLAYVDATIIHAISYPQRYVLGRAVIGRTPMNHEAFMVRFLIQTQTKRARNAFVIGRSVLGRAALHRPSYEPLDRALAALRVAKAPETQVRVDFEHKRYVTLDDGLDLGAGHPFGARRARNRL